jgi:hypothetical protein
LQNKPICGEFQKFPVDPSPTGKAQIVAMGYGERCWGAKLRSIKAAEAGKAIPIWS